MRYQTLLSVAQLAVGMNDSMWMIFDCRFDLADTDKGRQSYLQAHIPGAIYAHLDDHLSSPITPDSGRHPLPDSTLLTSWLGECGFDGRQQVVVYDDCGGAMAARLWWLLKALGHQDVALLDGGWQAWNQDGQEVETTLPERVPGGYQAPFDVSMVVGSAEIERNIEQRQFTLIDVRSYERYAGIEEPIDPVAGHIPGAVNLPLTENLHSNGCFKPAAQLRSMYTMPADGGDLSPRVFMCGSGVTACHSVLAMVHAGCAMPRLYAGSWSEWITDPQRPIATV